MEWHAVARADELREGEMRAAEMAGHEIALYRIAEGWFATDRRCTHARAMLTDGYLEEHVVECPLHFGKFDVRSGAPLSPPCKEPLRTYPVRVEPGLVAIGLDPAITGSR